MSNSDIADTLSYLTDEQLLGQIKQNAERYGELHVALRRNQEQSDRLARAFVARGLSARGLGRFA